MTGVRAPIRGNDRDPCRAYAGVINRLAAELGRTGSSPSCRRGDRRRSGPPLGQAHSGDMEPQPARRGVLAEPAHHQEKRWPAPAAARRRRAAHGAATPPRALPRAHIERLLSRRDIPLRKDAMADTLRDRRLGRRDPRGQRPRLRPGAGPGVHPVQGRRHPNSSTGTPGRRTCCPGPCACPTAPRGPADQCS